MTKKILFIMFCCCMAIASCNKTDQVISEKYLDTNTISIDNPFNDRELLSIVGIVECYKYIQKGYNILDSTLNAIDTNNITEDDASWILYVSTQLHKNMTTLYVEQFLVRAAYCEKIHEALKKTNIKEKYPDMYKYFSNEIGELSQKESLMYDRLLLEYLFYNNLNDSIFKKIAPPC